MIELLRILVVCTGNICRSPLAERLLQQRLGDRAVVTSAGVRGLESYAMDPAAAAQLRRLGGDSTGFRSRRLVDSDVSAADLVITMTQVQRSEVLVLEPRGLRRTFTLRELAHLLERDGAPSDPSTTIARLATAQSTATLHDYDIPDPIGGSEQLHAEVADQIAACVDVVAAAITRGWSEQNPRMV
ncbi:MAG: hypothetical protein M3474_01825 [Actinomycetota bacterium]|nr:hypothetical protein [Actinomycetota bacterium]